MPDNLTTVEDLIHAEALVAIARCWLHEAHSSLEFHEG